MLTDVQVFGEYPYHMKAKMKKEGNHYTYGKR